MQEPALGSRIQRFCSGAGTHSIDVVPGGDGAVAYGHALQARLDEGGGGHLPSLDCRTRLQRRHALRLPCREVHVTTLLFAAPRRWARANLMPWDPHDARTGHRKTMPHVWALGGKKRHEKMHISFP